MKIGDERASEVEQILVATDVIGQLSAITRCFSANYPSGPSQSGPNSNQSAKSRGRTQRRQRNSPSRIEPSSAHGAYGSESISGTTSAYDPGQGCLTPIADRPIARSGFSSRPWQHRWTLSRYRHRQFLEVAHISGQDRFRTSDCFNDEMRVDNVGRSRTGQQASDLRAVVEGDHDHRSEEPCETRLARSVSPDLRDDRMRRRQWRVVTERCSQELLCVAFTSIDRDEKSSVKNQGGNDRSSPQPHHR